VTSRGSMQCGSWWAERRGSVGRRSCSRLGGGPGTPLRPAQRLSSRVTGPQPEEFDTVTSGDCGEDVEDRVQLVLREPAVGVLAEQQLALAVADGLQRYVDHRHDVAVRAAQPDPPEAMTCSRARCRARSASGRYTYCSPVGRRCRLRSIPVRKPLATWAASRIGRIGSGPEQHHLTLVRPALCVSSTALSDS
jgi:hypothetical protein